MPNKRQLFVDLRTGIRRPAIPQRPVLSSAAAPWDGVLIEEHADASRELLDLAPMAHTIVLQLSEAVSLEWKDENGSRHRRHVYGEIDLLPAMFPFSVRSKAAGDILMVSLEPKFLHYTAHELIDPEHLEIRPHLGFADELLWTTALALKAEVEAGNPGGRCYGESLATAMAVHVVRRYAASRPKNHELRGGGLAPYQLRRAIDFIHGHMSEDLSLSDVAHAAGLSPFHFARLFKASTGLPPHRYIVQCRVERAKGLLLRPDLSIAEIASQLGFCDQSHFSAQFKRVYGITPKQFTRQAARK